MYDFEYHRPQSLDEALQLVGANEDAKIIAGGMTLLPTMKLRLAMPTDLIDLGDLDELRVIHDGGDFVDVGALATHASVAGDAVVSKGIPALAALANRIGDAQVRNRGTIGGSLANSDPAADYPAAVLALDATIRTDRREIPADDYFRGLFETALEPDEIIVGLRFPKPRRSAYAKYPHPASRYAIAGVFVAQTADAFRVAVTGAGPCAFRLPELEGALGDACAPEAVERLNLITDDFNEDLFASAEYRGQLVLELSRRAIRSLTEQ